MRLEDVAQQIVQHAQTGPSTTPGVKVRNTLSPHLERFIVELVRNYIIKETQLVEKAVYAELSALRALVPELSQAQFDLSVSRVLEHIRTIYF